MTRTDIQTAIAPAVIGQALSLEGLDLNDPAHQRRFLRALVHIGAAELLSRGMSVKQLAAAALEAVVHEQQAFAAKSLHDLIPPTLM